MKILFLTPYLGQSYGGITKVTQEIAHALAKLDVTLDLITTLADDQALLQESPYTWIEKNNYRIQYFPCIHKNDFILSLPLLQWLKENITDYHLVHTHTLFSPLISWAARICRKKNILYLITPHGMLEPWAFSYKSWKKQLYYRFIEKENLNQAAAIQGLSSTEIQNFDRYLINTPRFLVSNGIHAEDFYNLPSPEIFYSAFPQTQHKTLILFLARIDPKKGLDLLAPAFAQVKTQFPEVHLVIAGPDSIGFRPTVEKYFAEVGCQDSITFTGMLSGELKYAALAASQVYVAPSYSEGFSMSVLEGMAAGLPCVITTGCNFPEAAIAQAADVVDINSESIAQSLIQCLANPQAAQEMGERAKQFILSNYTWDSIAKKMIEVYDAILSDRPIPYSN
jgi:glycosyltransferase involved in cell wall biosynthesis